MAGGVPPLWALMAMLLLCWVVVWDCVRGEAVVVESTGEVRPPRFPESPPPPISEGVSPPEGVPPPPPEGVPLSEEKDLKKEEEQREVLRWMADIAGSEDPYVVLGVSRTATQAEIRKAYRSLSLRFHPDRHDGSEAAVKVFQHISGAYEIIGDPDRRAVYDDFGGKDQMQGFHSQWEYAQANRPATRDFYTGSDRQCALLGGNTRRGASKDLIECVQASACRGLNRKY
eukprot:RCo052339